MFTFRKFIKKPGSMSDKANEISNYGKEQRIKRQLKNVYNKVYMAAIDGYHQVDISADLDEETYDILRKEGFTINQQKQYCPELKWLV